MPSRGRRWGAAFASFSLVTGLLVPALLTGAASPASADTSPPVTTPATPATVSSDLLPTVQIGQGVVWDQAVVGNTVYVVGEFTTARPAGVAIGGAGEVARSNILAYDLTTGVLSTTWVPSLNGPGRVVRASADGKTIYVGGSFTAVNGVTRNRVAALDAATGALTAFNPNADARVTTLDVQGGTVYLGGIFAVVGGQARSRIAAVSATTGAVLSWAPSANDEVMAIAATTDGSRVVVGGRFTTMNGAAWYGMAALDATTGATLPWAAVSTIRNAGANSAIYSLKTDGTRIYGTGYTFGSGGNFEGSFAANPSDGSLVFVTGCRGDEYDNVPIGQVLYYVGHIHDCATINGNPEITPRTYHHAIAETTYAAPSGLLNEGGNFNGLPAPELLTWRPVWTPGTYTGQSQAPWTIEGNASYVVVGGEFPSVNGVAQQGLARFAVRSIAPNKDGIRGSAADLTPTLQSILPGQVRVSWLSAWDRDNRTLTYQVLRGDVVATATVVASFTADTEWFRRPQLAVNDASAPAGTVQTYRIRVRDPFGNTLTGSPATVTVPAAATLASYPATVLADQPSSLWRLGESTGTVGYDWSGGNDLTLGAGLTRGVAGAMTNESATATTFPGTATAPAYTQVMASGPQSFALETWFRTTTTLGGKLIGFGDRRTTNSARYDRQIYMANNGQLFFGVNPGSLKVLQTGRSYNDGQWHHVVANLGSTGMELFVDGVRVARDTSVTRAQVISQGYWRIGGDTVANWPSAPSSLRFNGTLEDVAVYPKPLTATQVNAHYAASGRTGTLPAAPADAYGAAVATADPGTYWRLDEPAGTTTALNAVTGDRLSAYSAGVVRGEAGAPANPTGTSIRLPGTGTQSLVSTRPAVNPTVFSLQTWFRTTSTTGGRIIGFGSSSSPTTTSTNSDRFVSMLNNGTLRYSVFNGSQNVITSTQSYNDGQWHLVVATQSADGTRRLYVDGALVASGASVTPQNYTGYWRLGSDATWGESTSANFAGSLDEAAVYETVLSPETIAQHYALGKPAGANQPPTAAFTSSCTQLACTFDGTGSTDADGSVASYAWDFGDGSTGTGATASRTYAAGGSYTVTLTVTDNGGATNVVTRVVTVAGNQAPTSSFTSTVTGASVALDGSASADPDGTVTGYAWDFGDGTSGTGATTSHTYAASGSYTVTLTVTDNSGATGGSTQTVTVTVPVPPLATDTFERTVASGFGTADTGGSWTLTGLTGSTASVGGGSGLITVGIGRNPTALLPGVSSQNTRVAYTTWAEALPTGGGTYLTTVLRSGGTGSYRARVRIMATGATTLQLTRVDAGVETLLGTAVTVPGLTYTAGTKLRIVGEAVGTGTTTLRAKVWVDGTTEPAGWTATQTDTTAGLQVAGSAGFSPYLSASATATLGIRYDDLTVSTATP